jgi:ABC-type phosphate transport system substrate-binding protein
MFKSIKARATTLAIAALLTTGAQATNITGAGSSFVYPVLSKWSAAFHDKTGNEVNYQSIGSGGGIAQIKAATVDFGASDAPLKDEDLKQFGLGQFPVVVGGIVPVVDIAGVKPGQLKLTGAVLAQIYMGTIKTWNDPRSTSATIFPRPAPSGRARSASAPPRPGRPEWVARAMTALRLRCASSAMRSATSSSRTRCRTT